MGWGRVVSVGAKRFGENERGDRDYIGHEPPTTEEAEWATPTRHERQEHNERGDWLL